MSWVPLKEGSNVHHLVSAIYDDRTAAPLRPAVLVFGFVSFWQSLESSRLYCLLHYDSRDGDGERKQECMSEPVKVNEDGQCEIMRKNKDTVPVTYYCPLNRRNSKFRGQIPTQVQLSTDSSCYDKLSRPLNVSYWGQRSSYKGKVGVCVHSALVRGNKQMGRDIVEFVEMIRVLGSESVTMYMSNTLNQDTRELVQKLSSRGGGREGEGGGGIAVNLVAWNGFRKGDPLHYYGQSLLLLDCIYRHIHQVELLVLVDLDEMILPVKDMSWADMIHRIDMKGQYASYLFLNKFFVSSAHSQGVAGKESSDLDKDVVMVQSPALGPRYFNWTLKLNCHFEYGVRSKTIVRPELVLSTCVHKVEKTVQGTRVSLKVPVTTGLLAHYRMEVIQQCRDRNYTSDNTALKYQLKYGD